MKRSVRILRRAQRDLEEIARYVAVDSPAAAARIVEQLLSAMELLEHDPELGRVARDERLQSLGYRYLVRGDYLVFYKLLGKQVRVYRVLHGRRQYAHLL